MQIVPLLSKDKKKVNITGLKESGLAFLTEEVTPFIQSFLKFIIINLGHFEGRLFFVSIYIFNDGLVK